MAKIEFESDIANSIGEPYVTLRDVLIVLQRLLPDEIYIAGIWGSAYCDLEGEARNKVKIVVLSGVHDQIGHTSSTQTKAFQNMPNLMCVVGAENVETVVAGAFENCTSLTSIALPAATTIGDRAFYNCTSLTSARLNAVTTIGANAFEDCTKLTSVETDRLTTLGTAAFKNTALTNYGIPGLYSVTTIPEEAFAGCTALTEVTIPKNVSKINARAFKGCTGLKTATILHDPDTIALSKTASGCKVLDAGIFEDCTSLKTLTIPFVGKYYHQASGSNFFGYIFGAGSSAEHETSLPTTLEKVIITSGNEIPGSAFKNCKYLTTVDILGKDQVQIGPNAFESCTRLSKVTFGEEVTKLTKIINVAFSQCSALKSITLPDSLNTIQPYAFMGTGLTSITIPDKVTSIDKMAFANCTSLKEVTLSSALTSLGMQVFSNCPSLIYSSFNTVDYLSSSNNTFCVIAKLNSTFNSNGLNDIDFTKDHIEITERAEPKFVLDGAFKGNTKLEIVQLPDTIIGIGAEAFRACSKLTSVYLPNSIARIGANAFTDVSSSFKLHFNGTAAEWEAKKISNVTGITVECNDETVVS